MNVRFGADSRSWEIARLRLAKRLPGASKQRHRQKRSAVDRGDAAGESRVELSSRSKVSSRGPWEIYVIEDLLRRVVIVDTEADVWNDLIVRLLEGLDQIVVAPKIKSVGAPYPGQGIGKVKAGRVLRLAPKFTTKARLNLGKRHRGRSVKWQVLRIKAKPLD